MPNSNSTAGAAADSEQKAKVTTSSPNNANPTVSRSTFNRRNPKFRAYLPALKKMTHSLTIEEWIKCAPFGCIPVWLEDINVIDKNGIQLHEGDIIKCWDNAAEDAERGLNKVHIGVIEYTPNCFSLRIPGKQTYNSPSVKCWANCVYLDLWINAENIEKIGDILQTPELLG